MLTSLHHFSSCLRSRNFFFFFSSPSAVYAESHRGPFEACLFCPLTQDAEVCCGSLRLGPSLHLRARLAPSCAPVATPPSRAWPSQGSSCSSGVVFASSLQYVRNRTLPGQPSMQTTGWGWARLACVLRFVVLPSCLSAPACRSWT